LCAENLFDSPQAVADFALDLYPISAVSMGQGALSAALKGAPFAVGTPLSLDAQITGHAAAGGGSAGSSTGSGGSAGSGSGGCPSGDLLVSTLNCSPVGSGGAASYCLSPSEFMSATSQPLPAACAAQGTTGCLETAGGPAYGSLIRPCCPGFTCRVGSQCGDPTAAVGGTCLP
jgi:hypothetical protein